MDPSKPVSEVVVEGELSPFEHEALYSLLKKHFRLEQPAYSDLLDEAVGTRVSIVFHHPYDQSFFTDNIQDDWRGLKDLFKQISYRRGRLGAAFTLTFVDQKLRLVFSLGLLEDDELGSAMDQIGHLTGIIGQMMRPDTMIEPLEQVQAFYDRRSDRWQGFRGIGLSDRREYVFDESAFQWKTGQSLDIVFVPESELSSAQRWRISELQKECFSHVSRKEIQECFIAKGFGWIFAYETGFIVGQVELHIRTVFFEEKQVLLGGLGGTCVTAAARNRGIAKALVEKGLEILKREKRCDVACLSADIGHHRHGGLYHQLGFTLMKRKISFEDVHGRMRHDIGELFIPLCSKETYDFIMKSNNTFHLGRGYW